jgi:hypothetical protein
MDDPLIKTMWKFRIWNFETIWIVFNNFNHWIIAIAIWLWNLCISRLNILSSVVHWIEYRCVHGFNNFILEFNCLISEFNRIRTFRISQQPTSNQLFLSESLQTMRNKESFRRRIFPQFQGESFDFKIYLFSACVTMSPKWSFMDETLKIQIIVDLWNIIESNCNVSVLQNLRLNP